MNQMHSESENFNENTGVSVCTQNQMAPSMCVLSEFYSGFEFIWIDLTVIHLLQKT